MEVWGFAVAILLGALIGLQREYTKQHFDDRGTAGLRTFTIIALIGAVLGYLSGSMTSLLVIVGFVGIMIFAFMSYYLAYKKTKDISETTQAVFIFTYIIGAMCVTGYLKLAVIIGIIAMALLTFKERLHGVAKKMDRKEIVAIVKFALITFVVFPLLPNKNYSPADIPGLGELFSGIGINTSVLSQLNVFNPSHIWLMIVLIAGINFIGYFLSKSVGTKRGFGLMGIVGGLVSSTAVTLSMASQSKKNKNLFQPFLVAVIVAMSIMFIRIIFEVAVVNNSLLPTIFLPMFVMALLGFLISFMFYKRKRLQKESKPQKIELTQPFDFIPALKFGLFFAVVLFIAKIAQLFLGNAGIYLTSILSGLMDVDAITLSMASLSKAGEVGNFVASTAILLAAISNTLVKAGMALFLGSKKFGKRVVWISIGILLAGLAVLFFI